MSNTISLTLCFLLVCYCFQISATSPTQLGQGVSYHVNNRMAFDIQSTLGNDGGNTQNNGTSDNGLWTFYGSQQPGTSTRAEKTYPYSLYVEKSVQVLTNWARMSPVGFKSRFNSMFNANVTLSANGGLAPFFDHFNLVEAARYHSYDMSANNCFSHASCNGEDTFVRVKTFYNKNVGMAENIAAGYGTPLQVTMGWINSAGHRANILGGYTLMGVGYFPRVNANSQYGTYWTQNFAGGTHGISSPIVSLTHIQLTAGQLTFLTNYYHKYDLTNSRKLKSIALYLDDVGYNMNLPSTNQFNDVSTSGMGTYEFTIAANTTKAAGCRKYYVKAVDASGYEFYYPSYGYLLTQDENTGCTAHYLAQRKSSDVVLPTPPPAISKVSNSTRVTSRASSNHFNEMSLIVMIVISMIASIL